jgi:hypothetical protein
MVERRNNSPLNLRVVLISGGWPGETTRATGEGHEWERLPTEGRSDFIRRVVAAARVLRLKSVVIGGLGERKRA